MTENFVIAHVCYLFCPEYLKSCLLLTSWVSLWKEIIVQSCVLSLLTLGNIIGVQLVFTKLKSKAENQGENFTKEIIFPRKDFNIPNNILYDRMIPTKYFQIFFVVTFHLNSHFLQEIHPGGVISNKKSFMKFPN